MKSAPLPADERQRQLALANLDVLDSPANPRVDRVVRAAADDLSAPIAYVSFVDTDRQWLKSNHGMPCDETGRDVAFCAHAILEDEALVIPDAHQDERFADNPLVVGEPFIRSYLGIPLRSPNGFAVGTLCVADTVPREFTHEQVKVLQEHARTVERELTVTVLKTLVVTDLVDSTKLVESLGDARASDLFGRQDRLARDLLAASGGIEIDKTDGFLLLFERPLDAVEFALGYHDALDELGKAVDCELKTRVGIHVAEVVVKENSPEDVQRGAKPIEVEGLAKSFTARLMSLAGGRQTLLSRSAFDVARRIADDIRCSREGELRWLDHGDYFLKGLKKPVDVYEVGVNGFAPLQAPSDTEKARRAVDADDVLGWRPAQGQEIPGRPRWVLECRLGEGGFGEVWLAEHRKTGDRRVFKFCYDRQRLQALQREVTLFRLMKEVLGDRRDISRILDWQFDEAPYFLESEYTAGGSLPDWAEEQGGIGAVPLETRLDIVAQAAEAVAAAHSVGVLHKDIKPGNLLIRAGRGTAPKVTLTDFGIGQVIDNSYLVEAGITVLGMESSSELDKGSTGTPIYAAPEILAGHPPSIQADIYALGVLLYQMVCGDLQKVLAQGWERDVDDVILREDITAMVDGSPTRRLGNALRISEWLRDLEPRRQARIDEQIAAAEHSREERRLRAAAKATTRRRQVSYWVAAVLVTIATITTVQSLRIRAERDRANLEAAAAREVSEFMVELFAAADPTNTLGQEVTVREMLDQGARQIESELDDQPITRARVQHTMGRAYRGLGLDAEAEPLLAAALTERRRNLDDDDPEVLQSLYSMAHLRTTSGDYAEAEALYREVLERRERTLGADHPEVGDALASLARLFRDMDRYEEAVTLSSRALEVLEEASGYEAALSFALYDRGWLHDRLGNYEAAEDDHRRALALQDEVLAPEHPSRVNTLAGLARALEQQGHYGEAEELFGQAIAIQEQVLGADHPNLANSINGLAILHAKQGEHELAGPLFLRSLEIRERSYAPTSPIVGDSLVNLGINYKNRGLYAQAEPLYERALGILEERQGPESIAVGSLLHNLAELYRAWSKFEEAEGTYLRSVQIWEATLMPDHPYHAYNSLALANLYRDSKRPGDAEALYRQALALREEKLGSDHPETLEVIADYVRWLRMQGRDAEARDLAGLGRR